MSTEVVVEGEERANISDRKRAKLTTPTDPLDDHIAGSPIVVPVFENDTTAELPPRRQYLARSKVAATSSRSGKTSRQSHSNSSSSNETTGNTASASSPSL